MKSILANFKAQKDNGVSDYIKFYRAVAGKGFSRYSINEWFGKLVPKSDYQRKDRERLIEILDTASNPLCSPF